MTLVAARGLTVRYGGVAALTGVDFAIDGGEIVTLVGPNGSGKSTLVRAGLE
ncbi:ATP-binding cassette domain-containing protein, partial [Rhodovulum sulfidophilum]|uniref:ATP-binding cassette domain-containing protein n=1 Tax=Rhodovulum sulfidophilum TaxID=35806 RepID=UPI0019211F75